MRNARGIALSRLEPRPFGAAKVAPRRHLNREESSARRAAKRQVSASGLSVIRTARIPPLEIFDPRLLFVKLSSSVVHAQISARFCLASLEPNKSTLVVSFLFLFPRVLGVIAKVDRGMRSGRAARCL